LQKDKKVAYLVFEDLHSHGMHSIKLIAALSVQALLDGDERPLNSLARQTGRTINLPHVLLEEARRGQRNIGVAELLERIVSSERPIANAEKILAEAMVRRDKAFMDLGGAGLLVRQQLNSNPQIKEMQQEIEALHDLLLRQRDVSLLARVRVAGARVRPWDGERGVSRFMWIARRWARSWRETILLHRLNEELQDLEYSLKEEGYILRAIEFAQRKLPIIRAGVELEWEALARCTAIAAEEEVELSAHLQARGRLLDKKMEREIRLTLLIMGNWRGEDFLKLVKLVEGEAEAEVCNWEGYTLNKFLAGSQLAADDGGRPLTASHILLQKVPLLQQMCGLHGECVGGQTENKQEQVMHDQKNQGKTTTYTGGA
jgi:hypothetical protein